MKVYYLMLISQGGSVVLAGEFDTLEQAKEKQIELGGKILLGET